MGGCVRGIGSGAAMTSPDEPVRVTLPGAQVTAEVTWEQVRAYLRAEGWTMDRINVTGTTFAERWQGGKPKGGVWVDASDCTVGDTVTLLARLASVAPGEMLARIAGSCPPVDPRWYDAGDGVHALNYTVTVTSAARVVEHGPGDIGWRTFEPDGSGLDSGTCSKVGEAMAAAEASIARIAGPTNPHVIADSDIALLSAVRAWADALAGRRWTDAIRALDVAYGLTRPGRAMHTNARGAMEIEADRRRAAEDMRGRCAAEAIRACERGYDDPEEIAARIRALPIDGGDR